jgi:phospholipid/cholesterol/gamma-HCH transport system substrate-binding protein
MSESPQRQAVIVGLFVSIGIAILIGALFTLGSMTEMLQRNVQVTTVFDDVGGLKKGDAVWFSGVPVGTIKEVRFDGGPQVEVEMAIDSEASPFIRADAMARVSSDGLIGNKIIVLYGGTPEAEAIESGDALQSSVSLSPEQVMAMFQENNKNLLAITTDLKGVASKIAAGEGSVGKLLADDHLYNDLTNTVSAMQDAAVNAQVMTGNLANFAGKVNQEGHLAHDLVTDKTTYASLTSSVEKFESAATSAATIVDKLEQGTSDPATPLGTLLHDEEAGEDLKETLDNLNEGSMLLSENLEAMQHNFLLRGFFKKKDKEKEEKQQRGQAQKPAPQPPETDGAALGEPPAAR